MKRRLVFWAALLGVGVALCHNVAKRAPAATSDVVILAAIEGMVDLGMGPFVERVLEHAAETGAALVVLEVNTLGGRVDAAVAIRDHLLGSRVPSVAFVHPRAISAGALIALAAEEIAMASGGTIGAATPVMLGEPGQPAQPVEEKTVSYVRKEFRATADARGRPGLIAEAMVDADVEIEGLIDKGKLLTLTTEEALRHGVADREAEDVESLLRELGWADAEIRRIEMNWAERVVRFLTHPVLASLLMTLGILGLVIELRTPGLGVPGLVGVLCLAAFFWGHSLVRLVGWEQIILVGVGVVLLLLEILVIPGFGIVGVVGALAALYGLTTSLIGAGASLDAILGALSRVAISLLMAALASLALLRFLPRLPGGRKLVLGAALPEGGALTFGGIERPRLTGAAGVALTPLRPAGIASVEGKRVDVVSQGEFIEQGQPLVVIRDEGTRVIVRQGDPSASKGDEE